jgi:hypothetical protein
VNGATVSAGTSAGTQKPRQELRTAGNLMAAAIKPEKRERLTGAAG